MSSDRRDGSAICIPFSRFVPLYFTFGPSVKGDGKGDRLKARPHEAVRIQFAQSVFENRR
jgi:hypothetical protein